MASAEDRRAKAEERMRGARNRARVAHNAYDKPGMEREKRASLAATNEALAANEEVKRDLGVPGDAAARNALRNVKSAKDRSMKAADEASRILTGAQRSDAWQ